MKPPISRRKFLSGLGATALAASLRADGRKPRILLRSSWQTVNIGDIGHTPGALSLLDKYFPEAEVTLWPNKLTPEVRDMLTRGYPRLKIVDGGLGADNKPDSAELAKAWADADFYLSGSGSGFPASNHAAAFHSATGKPMGVFGVSTDPISGIGEGRTAEGGTLKQLDAEAVALPSTHLSAALRKTIDNAKFFFCRDTVSLDYLKRQGVTTPVLEFGPDAQLGMHLRDDAKGLALLRDRQLEEGKFICVVPRLRYTPYSNIRNTARTPADAVKDAINERTVESDHAKLREMMAAYVTKTGHKVLACPEMTYQVALAKERLVDPLPEEIKKKVVWLDRFWLPDEAASVYSKARAVISIECHSPLIALRNGTPTFYVRQPTDTCKGQMYRDIGAGEWFFEIDETSGEQLWSRLEGIQRDPTKAKAKVSAIMAFVQGREKRMVEAVRAACG
jgi:hypothetical protein